MSREGGGADHGRRILTWAPELEEDSDLQAAPAADPEPEQSHRPEAPRSNGLALSTSAPRPVKPAVDGEEDGQRAKRKRGRPKGRAVRRQVHFHVDPREEELLLAAVARYGSQQKGLIAALASLQEAELLHDEIARLREENERQRRLLEDAQALFRR
jgi:hypothetical protein